MSNPIPFDDFMAMWENVSGFMIVQTNRECTKKQCENFVTP